MENKFFGGFALYAAVLVVVLGIGMALGNDRLIVAALAMVFVGFVVLLTVGGIAMLRNK